jgi:hypothetical protein
MSIRLSNIAGNLTAFIRGLGATAVPVSGEGVLGAHLEDLNGRPLAALNGAALNPEQYGLPAMVVNDNNLILTRGDRFGSLATAVYQPLFTLRIDGATLNSRQLVSTLSTMTVTQSAAGGVVLNAAASVAINTYALLTTIRAFVNSPKLPLMQRWRIRGSQFGIANATGDFGFTTTAPATLLGTVNTSGAYWRMDANGVMPILAINGAVVETGINVASLVATNTYIFDVIKDDDSFTFTVQDSYTSTVLSRQTLNIPLGQLRSMTADHLYGYTRVFNSGAAPATATTLTVTSWQVCALDVNMQYNSGELASMNGEANDYTPTTVATTSSLANSTAATTITLSNATATLASTIIDGGVRFAAPVGAVTDYILFGYNVPAPSQLKTKGVVLTAKNLGAAVATTPTQIDFFLKTNATALTLATTGANYKYLGTQTFPVGAVIGSPATEGRIVLDFNSSPVIAEAGRWHVLVARVSTGTATASQVIEVMFTAMGHFE